MPQQDVMRVGHLAHKLLAKPLSVDGRKASVVHLKHSVCLEQVSSSVSVRLAQKNITVGKWS